MRREGETSEHDTDLMVMQEQKKGREIEEEESQTTLQFQETFVKANGTFQSQILSCV